MSSHDPGKTDQADMELSQIYQSLHAPEVGAAVDEAILNFAKQRVLVRQSKPVNKRVNWTGGFSVAASILAVSILYWTQFAPQNIVPVEPSTVPELTSATSELTSPDEMRIASDTLQPAESLVKTHDVQLNKIAETKVLAKMAARSKRSAAIANTDEKPELATLDLGQAQPADALQYVQEEALATPPRFEVSAVREQNVSLEPKCLLSLQGGYQLSSTALAEFIQTWEQTDKTWLVKQLNSFRPLAMIVDSYPGENQETLKSEDFETAYTETLESLKNCKQQTEPVQ